MPLTDLYDNSFSGNRFSGTDIAHVNKFFNSRLRQVVCNRDGVRIRTSRRCHGHIVGDVWRWPRIRRRNISGLVRGIGGRATPDGGPHADRQQQ